MTFDIRIYIFFTHDRPTPSFKDYVNIQLLAKMKVMKSEANRRILNPYANAKEKTEKMKVLQGKNLLESRSNKIDLDFKFTRIVCT